VNWISPLPAALAKPKRFQTRGLISDHGFPRGAHGGRWAKRRVFDAATRVPMVVAGAGVPAGKVLAEPVELIDVFPTLVELGGFAPPPGVEGRSLVAVMQGRPSAGFRPALSMVYHYDPVQKTDVLGRTVIAADWRYTEWAGGAAGRELYWRAEDPAEYRNRAGDPKLAGALNAGAAYLQNAPTPKPGPANRPRALLEAGRTNP
jgi:arylsulfatase A-like enzyme